MKIYKKDGDALAITDEEIKDEWQLGMTRALARVIAGSALPEDRSTQWGLPVPGSDREHLSYKGFGSQNTEEQCRIVEVYDIVESTTEDWYHNSFGPGTSVARTSLEAKVTCACGRLVRKPVSMSVPIGELIYEVMNADK